MEISAFCDMYPAAAEKLNQDISGGRGKVFSDYNELLKEDLDAVCVLTPNNTHSEISIAALKAGKHVICEKPMAITYNEARAMLDARDESGKILSIGYQERFRLDSLYLKEECKNGTLGEIYFAKATALRRRAVPTWGVFLDREKQGGGPLIDIGTHSLDLALFMMDNYEPSHVLGTAYQKLNTAKNQGNAWGDWDHKKHKVEDSAFALIVMKNGASIILETSWALNITDEKEAVCTLCGTKGGAEMQRGGDLLLNGVKNNKPYNFSPLLKPGSYSFYTGGNDKSSDREARNFRDAILGREKPYVLPEKAAVVTQILEGIYKSAATGKAYHFND